MSSIATAEQLAQRALDVNILDEADLQPVWSELGTRNVEAEQLAQSLTRRGLLTPYQLERLQQGQRTGFFYGDYKILYCVGAGTFARVYRAEHRETHKMYAVKVLRNRMMADPVQADAFRREGELGSTLKHLNIVPIHEVVSKRALHYIVMDFIEGRNLRDDFRIRKKFDPMQAAQIMDGVMAGLSYAFQNGVTHRDLKLSNVLISSEGVAKIVDFGLAALESEGGDASNKRTVEYAALERATGVRKDDTRSDIYFAGCMFYHMLSGISPLPEGRDRVNRMNKQTFLDIKPIMSVAPNVPPALAMIISRALELDPQKRYQTPADMLSDIKIAIRRMKAGADADTGKQELASREGFDESGQPRRIMVIESDMKRQDVMRELFKRNGYRVLVSSDPERAMQRFLDDPTAADVVLFSSSTIGHLAVEAFNRFGEETVTKDMPLVLLLDEAHVQWAEEANEGAHRFVAKMPIKLRRLREVILMALKARVA